MAVEDDLRALEARRSSALAQRARDEVEVENATGALAKAKEDLKAEGIVTGEDFRRIKEELETQIAEETANIERALEAAGA